MNSSTLNIINKKLENEPQEILDRVLAYLEDILEDKNSKKADFELTEEQKNSLHKINNRPLEEHTDVENFVSEMKSKYGI